MPRVDSSGRPPGVVYTTPWVARFMLDLAGYTEDRSLASGTIIEPGCGNGNILVEIVRRLMIAAQRENVPMLNLEGCVFACDIDPNAVSLARERVATTLMDGGVNANSARHLAEQWIKQTDYLLEPPNLEAQWIVGNPPYVRVEEVEKATYAEYRERWTTMTGRSDIYIGFFEASLALLASGGVLTLLCADRWMHNQYGAGLRKLIALNYAVDLILDVHEVDVFTQSVSAYPAITVMRRGSHRRTTVGTATQFFNPSAAEGLLVWLSAEAPEALKTESAWVSQTDSELSPFTSWPTGPPDRLARVHHLESRLKPLEDDGISVRVGIATGADKVYIVGQPPNVELDRLIPVVGPSDLDVSRGVIAWKGRYLVSPWVDDHLIDISQYPNLRSYYERHADALRQRHVAKIRTPWWRTIDKPRPHEFRRPKLIISDINDRIEPILDRDGYWPLHSTYYVVSDRWDLEVLGGFLLSDIADEFVRTYSVKFRRDHIRVSAQYLRRVCVPPLERISASHRDQFKSAFRCRDRELATRLAQQVVQLLD